MILLNLIILVFYLFVYDCNLALIILVLDLSCHICKYEL